MGKGTQVQILFAFKSEQTICTWCTGLLKDCLTIVGVFIW